MDSGDVLVGGRGTGAAWGVQYAWILLGAQVVRQGAQVPPLRLVL